MITRTLSSVRFVVVVLAIVSCVSLITSYAVSVRAANKGLTIHLNLNENDGSVAADSSGNSINATLVGGHGWNSPGVIGGSLDLDGSNYLTIPRQGLTDFTISTWIRTSSGTRGDILMDFNGSAEGFKGIGLVLNPGFGTCTTGGVVGLWVGDLTDGYICTSSGISDGNWHLVTATWSDSTKEGTIYIDGSEAASGTRPAASTGSDISEMFVGYNSYGSPASFFIGSVDDMRIYSNTLSSSEVQAIYAKSAPTVSLIGNPSISITVGDIFNDLGATATDFEDNVLSIASSSVPSPIDTTASSTYAITYTATDSSGLSGSVTRTLIVNPLPSSDTPPGSDPGTSTPPTTDTSSSTPPIPPTSIPTEQPQSLSGGHHRSVASMGRVLGATAPCGMYISQPLTPMQDNNPEDVVKLQALINETTGANLPLTGIFGPRTLGALKDFQTKYRSTIIDPWVKSGHITNGKATGMVGTTTLWTINNMVCPSLQLPQPVI